MEENVCSICNLSYKYYKNLRQHAKKHHSANLNEIAPLKNSSNTVQYFKCSYCEKKFSAKRNLNFHLKTHAGSNETIISNNSVGKKCPLCNYMGKFRDDLYSHFKSKHDLNIEIEKLTFSSSDEFREWLVKYEKDNQTKFVIEKRSSSFIHYVCHRSGFFKSRGSNKRHLKTQGSKKINASCPARIEVVIDDNKQDITFIKTHVGHEHDLCHLVLSEDERKMLATKIAMKISFSAILDDVRESVSKDSLERIHLLTKKDLFNIEACFNLHSSSQRHKSDAISVDAWVNEMKDSCVLFYKPQDTYLKEYPQFRKEDFVLIIMTDGQKSMLSSYAHDCICIDGTHGLNSYNFEMHTIVVLDDLHQGFPAAFCISSRSDEIVMIKFFECVRAEIGPVSTKVFMSDMAEAYYNAWIKVMPMAQYRLFCTWHIDRAWRKNLHHIRSKEKQVAVYKMLRTLLQETDENAFERMIRQFLNTLFNDADTCEFGKYFSNYYTKNCASWGYCYRIQAGLNTNMHVERLHKTIKYIYLRGKNVKRLDKVIGALMNLVRDQLFDRLITLNKGKVCYKLQELRKRHASSLSLDTTLIIQINNGIWQVPSSSGSQNIYTIYDNKICDCQLKCIECAVCIHRYVCDCIDNAIKWNMCKHIHLLCQYLEKKKSMLEAVNRHTDSTSEILQTPENPSKICQKQKLTADMIFNTVASKNRVISVDDRKKDLVENFLTQIQFIKNEEQLHAVEELVKPIGPTINALENKVSFQVKQVQVINTNKNIAKQRRLFSIKKAKTKNSRYTKPTQQEQDKIVNLLLSK